MATDNVVPFAAPQPTPPASPIVNAPLTSLTIAFYIESVPFTPDVINGLTSLGGSESAAIGLANALAQRGHDVHIFAAKLDLGQPANEFPAETTFNGVQWHAAETLADTLRVVPPDVFISLRMPGPFAMRVGAGMSILWNQDMLTDVSQIAGAVAQADFLAFVSEWHRQQFKGVAKDTIGGCRTFVTRNGFDPSLMPLWPESEYPLIDTKKCLACGAHVTETEAALRITNVGKCACGGELGVLMMKGEPRDPFQFIHISRPERAMDPLLQMWPKIKARIPEAKLWVCRYDSMYDAGGWGQVCASYDEKLAAVNQEVGGIEFLGQLAKPELYQHLTRASLMLYPGIHGFGETSCIAAIEAQAAGCVFVGSHRGALPETVAEGAGVLIEGDAMSPAYQESFVEAVYTLCHPDEGPALKQAMQQAGRRHVFPQYTFGVLAQQWETLFLTFFRDRYTNDTVRILRQLLRYDHHAAAQLVARDILAHGKGTYEVLEVQAALERCRMVIAQEGQTSEDYGQNAMDPALESVGNGRFNQAIRRMKALEVKTVADVACGNGAFILALLRELPDAIVLGVDYSAQNIQVARDAIRAEFGDEKLKQVTLASYDLSDPSNWAALRMMNHMKRENPVENYVDEYFDAVWCGEYLEHTADPHLVIDALESLVHTDGWVFLSTPHGPLTELLEYHQYIKRGHTHHFQLRDLATLFGGKAAFSSQHLPMGETERGEMCGFWCVEWQRQATNTSATPCHHLHTILTTRPHQTIVATLMVKDAEEWLFKCLRSIYAHVDHILVLDTGSTDRTIAIANQFFNKVTVYKATEVGVDWPACGFSVPRNWLLHQAETIHHADWVMWIDADEHLVNGRLLHPYLQGPGPYNGYVVRQTHLMLDFDRFSDKPARILRANRGTKFYGLIHEQPETTVDGGVFPALDLPDVHMVHYGYETEHTRRWKLLQRNFPLLKEELKDPKARELATVLFIRDLVTLAGYEGGDQGRNMPQKARLYLLKALSLYRSKGMDNPAHKCHPLVWPSYQVALKWLKAGFEIEWAFAAAERLSGSPRHERMLVTSVEEGKAVIAHKTGQWLDRMASPTYDCTPWKGARQPDVPAPPPPGID